MPSEARPFLEDIARHIRLTTQFVAGLDFDAFQNDERTIFAVIRCLEVISEASRRLPEELKARHPSIPWKNIAGAGNVYRHDYEDIAPKIVWDTVQLALQPLLSVIELELNGSALHQTMSRRAGYPALRAQNARRLGAPSVAGARKIARLVTPPIGVKMIPRRRSNPTKRAESQFR